MRRLAQYIISVKPVAVLYLSHGLAQKETKTTAVVKGTLKTRVENAGP